MSITVTHFSKLATEISHRVPIFSYEVCHLHVKIEEQALCATTINAFKPSSIVHFIVEGRNMLSNALSCQLTSEILVCAYYPYFKVLGQI